MRKSLTLSIPEPCHENWSKMTPVDKGRFCNACSKTVYDFTKKTDEQIVKSYLENQNLCGRFLTNQLNKELVYSRKTTNNFRTVLASSLFSFLTFGINETKAQNKPQITQTDSVKQPTVKGKHAISVLNNKMVSGTISDENGLPLPGVNIIIDGTHTGTQTDFDGNFKINTKKDDILSFSFLGYKSKEKIIGNSSIYSFSMEVDSNFDYEVIVTGFINFHESYDSGYGYIQNHNFYPSHSLTSKELEREKIRKQKRKNYITFYKRKNREEKALRKEERAKRKASRRNK